MRVSAFAILSSVSSPLTTPLIQPPVHQSMNGQPSPAITSPMHSTFAFGKVHVQIPVRVGLQQISIFNALAVERDRVFVVKRLGRQRFFGRRRNRAILPRTRDIRSHPQPRVFVRDDGRARASQRQIRTRLLRMPMRVEQRAHRLPSGQRRDGFGQARRRVPLIRHPPTRRHRTPVLATTFAPMPVIKNRLSPSCVDCAFAPRAHNSAPPNVDFRKSRRIMAAQTSTTSAAREPAHPLAAEARPHAASPAPSRPSAKRTACRRAHK